MKPRLFIGSSGENLRVARALQESLERDAEVTVWDQGIFDVSKFVLESLLAAVDNHHFGCFVLAPDDVVRRRGKQFETARDNVVFELGLFIGRLGRERTIILVPRSAETLELASDLLGLAYVEYDDARTDGNLVAGVGGASNRIRKLLDGFSSNDELKPKTYGYDEFIAIESNASEEVWIIRPQDLLEVDSFYDVVVENLRRGVRYRYFVHPDYEFEGELHLLLERIARDPRVSEDPAGLVTAEHLRSTHLPMAFVLLDPTGPRARGFAILDNELRGPDCWVEMSGSQLIRFVASTLKCDKAT